ncbi:hypothetical protein PHYNN_217 [Pantoea phage Phynn]|nr:hypothetical protein PHYNN_217 [Pantoea phage Phynn]
MPPFFWKLEMERELRYDVVKRKDLEACIAEGVISEEENATLQTILEKLYKHRADLGKEPLECVVVESDWPEYEQVWSMIENRVQCEIEAAIMEQTFGPNSIPPDLPYFYVVDGKSLVCSDAHTVHRLLKYSGYKYRILYSTEPFDLGAVHETSWCSSPERAEFITRDVVLNMSPLQVIEESNKRRVK